MADDFECRIAEARSAAIKHIGINVYSSGKIRDYLIAKGYDYEIANEVVSELVRREYIDDLRACRKILYGRSGKKQESRAFCLNRLIQGGVASNIAEDYVSFLGEDKDTCLLLFDGLCSNKKTALETAEFDTLRKSLLSTAIRRGYGYELASSCFNIWINL